jgi:hypothetical protein
MPRCPERHPLTRHVRVGMQLVVRGEQAFDVDEILGLSGASGTGHGPSHGTRANLAPEPNAAPRSPPTFS